MWIGILEMMEKAERKSARKRIKAASGEATVSYLKDNITKLSDENKSKLLQELVRDMPITITYGCHEIELKEKQSHTGFTFSVDSITDKGIHIHII